MDSFLFYMGDKSHAFFSFLSSSGVNSSLKGEYVEIFKDGGVDVEDVDNLRIKFEHSCTASSDAPRMIKRGCSSGDVKVVTVEK